MWPFKKSDRYWRVTISKLKGIVSPKIDEVCDIDKTKLWVVEKTGEFNGIAETYTVLTHGHYKQVGSEMGIDIILKAIKRDINIRDMAHEEARIKKMTGMEILEEILQRIIMLEKHQSPQI